MVVSLTDAGRALHPRLVDLYGTLEAALAEGLAEHDRTDLLRTINALDQSLADSRRRRS